MVGGSFPWLSWSEPRASHAAPLRLIGRSVTPQVGVQTVGMQRALQVRTPVAGIRPVGELPANAPLRGPQGDQIQVKWDESRYLCCRVGRCGVRSTREAGPGWRGSSHSASRDRLNSLFALT